MTTLVVGGAASGKSAFAEELLCARGGKARRVYLATMEPFGAEAEARIERHRALRHDRGFETVECFVDLPGAAIPRDSAVLLEDVGNLCANELFSPQGAPEYAARRILDGVDRLRALCRELVIVSNEVFSGGSAYEKGTMEYLGVLSYVNRSIAAAADAVCEVSCGIAVYHKGERMG